MAIGIGTLQAFLRLDDRGFAKKLDAAAGKVRDAAGEMAALSVGLGAVSFALAKAGSFAVEAASNFDETSNVISAGFAGNAVAVEKWAKETADAMGRSQQQIRDFAGQLQVLIAPMIGSQSEATEMSKSFAKLSVDLGSFYNVADSDALIALKSGLTGEVEPLKRFGLTLNQASLEQFAFTQGIRKSIKDMSEAEKVQLRFNYVMEKTALAQGDAVRTAESFANQLKRLRGNVDDVAVAFGDRLKNALAGPLKAANAFLDNLENLNPGMLDLIAKVGLAVTVGTALVAALMGVGGAIALVAGSLPLVVGGFTVLATTVLPLIVIIGGLTVIIGNLYNLWKQNENALKSGASSILSTVGGAFKKIGEIIIRVWNAVADAQVEVFMAVPSLLAKSFSLTLNVIAGALEKIRPLLSALGLDGLADSAASGASGVRAFENDMMDALENVKRGMKNLLDPSAMFDGLVTSAGAVGGAIVDGVKSGLKGSALLLGDIFGVDWNAKGIATAANGATQDFGSTANAPKKEKLSAADRAMKERARNDAEYWENYSKAQQEAAKALEEASAAAALARVNYENSTGLTGLSNNFAPNIADLAGSAASGSGFGAVGGLAGGVAGGAISMALGDPTGQVGAAVGGALGGGVGGALDGVISRLPSLVKAGEAFLKVLEMAVAPFDAVIKPMIEFAGLIELTVRRALVPFYTRIAAVLGPLVEIGTKLFAAFVPLLTVLFEISPIGALLILTLNALIPPLTAAALGMDAFVRASFGFANVIIDLANSLGANMKRFDDSLLGDTGENEKFLALKAAKAAAKEEAKARAVQEALRRRGREADEEALDDLNRGGSLNLPEAFRVAAARANATNAGDDFGSVGPGGSLAPVVNVAVYLNGLLAEDVRRETNRTGRFEEFVDSGVVVGRGTRKKRFTGPRVGN